MNLRDIVNLLPRVMAHRFSDDAWIGFFNEVSIDVERKGRIPRVKHTFPVYIPGKGRSFKLPPFIHKVISVYQNGREIEFLQRSNWITANYQFNDGYDPSVDDAQVQVVSQDESELSIDFITFDPSFNLDFDPNGWAIFSSDGNYRLGYDKELEWGDDSTGISRTIHTVRQNFEEFPDATDAFVTQQFYLIEYTRDIQQITSAFEDLFEDETLVDVFKLGLWAKAERHNDSDSDEYIARERDYRYALRRWYQSEAGAIFKGTPKITKWGTGIHTR